MRMGGRDAPWLGALLWVLLLAACAAPENAAKAIGGGPETAEDAPMSALGSYLAGRHAQQEHDYGAAAQYFGRALAQDPGDYELLNKAFLFEVTEGH
ncbi:MAG: hypothetical protein JO010_05970, partial [Alphaproteobacteria bacterium]|nr:hypothetical protein [Alphaproteobacteria bacterium]